MPDPLDAILAAAICKVRHPQPGGQQVVNDPFVLRLDLPGHGVAVEVTSDYSRSQHKCRLLAAEALLGAITSPHAGRWLLEAVRDA